jgi:hypothetical protein
VRLTIVSAEEKEKGVTYTEGWYFFEEGRVRSM